MVLVSRIFTYVVPLIYLLVSLSWLLHSNWIYYGSALVITLLALSVFSITRQTGGFKIFLFEMIYPLFTQLISLLLVIFIAKSWLYVVLVIFFSGMLFFILNEVFDRYHPFLSKGFDFNIKLQTVMIVALVFFMSVIGYNFVLYLDWQLWIVSLGIIVLLLFLLLRLHGYNRKMEYLFVDFAIVVLTMEVFFILYYLPVDIYFKGLVVAANLFIIFTYIVNKQFYKITNQYEFKEKT